jgi:hypothetical protein
VGTSPILEKEDTTMIPAAFPGLPVAAFPGLLLPSGLLPAGTTVVDLTAAFAVIAWGLSGLIALRLAVRMSRRSNEPPHAITPTSPAGPRHGFRDAA